MRFSTFNLTTLSMFSATILGSPTIVELVLESGLRLRNSGDQGDGSYLVVFNDEGVANVQFTPMAKLVAQLKITTPDEKEAIIPPGDLSASATTCDGSTRDLNSLSEANRQLARNSDAWKHYGNRSWGWKSNILR
ncbi:hypothetical protein K458DRAFT_398606 [Lentithecium fluviatile CBS 122367]|uniref:Uncharacterized protein n=1 Tax=Lentithecium fluviatile CBS 122367 TaxID=1168545 RepID=A0A6G1JJ39_9PLEO|nr:hypothetical protein K458DRAFT_398606 [Lentithecium fluviatile CBS 122367]